jgi:two-component system response regulator ResD
MSRKMLIVEDDENISELFSLYMEREGFQTATARDGEEALSLFKEFSPDIILLDVMLPRLDGWGVLREIRAESNVPVIMITAKGETTDKVSGLQMGADDYIVKPFEMKEVIARVHAVMRRVASEKSEVRQLIFDNLEINMEAFELKVCGKRVDTPPKELELLFFLASSPNRVYTRDQL